jgi:radical SAM superfamily enzyme YgiQ (UPF0313 family)
MKVLLIIPTFGYKQGYPRFFSSADFPTGFAYLASAIRNGGHEIFGLNPNNDASYKSAHEMVSAKIAAALKKNKPDVVGLGGLSTDYKFIKDAIKIIRSINPSIRIVLGGGIINFDAEFIFSALCPDFCIIGEAEENFVKLLNSLERRENNFSEIPNLGYWDNNAPQFSKRNFDFGALDERAYPDYGPFDLSEMLDEYSMATRYVYRNTRPNPRPITIVSARGCPFSCTFCVHDRGGKYRSRSINNIILEIKELYEKYHFNILIILDELFIAKKDRLREFSLAILDGKEKYGWDFDWIFQTHANASLDREVFELAKRAGCYCFTYGVESASPRVLASMNKKTKPVQIIEGVQIANSLGLGFYSSLIFGDVAEDAETIRESMAFFSQHLVDTHIYSAAISPYPGSKLFDDCLKNGIIRDKQNYYEHIDEQIYNMTRMPDRLWFPWAYLVIYLWRFFQFVKSTDATSCIIDEDATNDRIAKYYKQAVYKIWAVCPHCGKEGLYREILADPRKSAADKQNILTSIKSFPLRFVGLSINKYNVPKIILSGGFWLLLGLRNPLLKTLKPLLGEREFSRSFTTGCQHCNKRIKVNVQEACIEHGFNKIRRLLLGICKF